MNSELTQKLFDKYPSLFRAVSSPFDEHGFECKDGWYDIINNACYLVTQEVRSSETYIKYLLSKNDNAVEIEKQKLLDAQDRLPIIAQIKEKFGTLVIFTDRCNDYQRGVFDMAESMSSSICEFCGTLGKTYELGWHRTLCEKHAEENYKNIYNKK
jgi:hypothetical protein